MHTRTMKTLEFERETMKKIKAKLGRWRTKSALGSGVGEIDEEECAAAALCLVWTGHPLNEAVRLAVRGGDIGTGLRLESDLSSRRLGYRPVKPCNAVPYAEHYKLPPCACAEEMAIREQAVASRSRISALVPEGTALFGEAWTWLSAKTQGATHAEAAAACGKTGSARALESFSGRLAEKLAECAEKLGFSADYDTGAGRTFAKKVKTQTPEDEGDWRAAVMTGAINLKKSFE